ncbi:hypothetical protein ES708_16215 [subsurface metagenome]
MITGTVPPVPSIRPPVWDTTFDYREAEKRFYARSDIDHRVYIHRNQAVWVNPATGEIQTGWEGWKP